MSERKRERGGGGEGDRECVRMFVVPYTNLATSSLTTATTKPKRQTIQQRREGEKGRESKEGVQRQRERGRKREEATGSQLDNFILQGSQKMCTKGSRG